MHTTISRCRHRLAFTLALRRSRGLAQCFPHRKRDVTGSLHTARALNRELLGTVLTPSP